MRCEAMLAVARGGPCETDHGRCWGATLWLKAQSAWVGRRSTPMLSNQPARSDITVQMFKVRSSALQASVKSLSGLSRWMCPLMSSFRKSSKVLLGSA